MKKFINNICFFGFISILLAFGIEYYLTQKLKNSNSEGEIIVWNDLYENNLINFPHFIYGSSRAWVHIDPFILEKELGRKYYNLGADGQNFTVQRFRHEELKERYNIESILYSVDIFTLSKREYIQDYDQFIPFMFWENNGIEDFLSSYNYYHTLDYYFPLIRYFGHKEMVEKIFQDDSEQPDRVRGYRGKEREWSDDLANAKEEKGNFSVEIDENLVKQFEEFIQQCKAEEIELILVYTPEYIEGQNFVSNRDEIVDIYKNFSQKYHLPFYNFSNDELSYKKKYFYNTLHLNKKGAEIFSHKLADTLK